ncbi:MAG: hypothetical protein A2132_00285 [Nitrospirae bacterium RBG_16_43_11]|nr:MAG: hypothetical protein A2132_00285 [Nitrospirae bacterium RBG_16_43_11]
MQRLDGFYHQIFSVIKNPSVLIDMVHLKFASLKPVERYQAWQDVNLWNNRLAVSLKERIHSRNEQLPLISVIMPVYNPPVSFLDKAISSVINQVYDNWELCIVDDCSTTSDVKLTIEKWARLDKRIKFKLLDKNVNISMATNYGAGMAGGEHLILLDHDDELTPDALAEVVLYLRDHPETDVLYSDDDKITPDGKRYGPQFKPDWSPELLLSYMYFSHIFVVRRSLYQSAGGMRTGFEGSQDYDLALRVTEKARDVGHIPKVLYHWRSLPSSTASSGSAKPESFEAGRRAVQETLDRRGINAKAYRPDFAVNGGLGLFAHEFQDNGPDVTILIPTRNNLATLRNCLESLTKTTYRNYEVIVIDNESDDPETIAYLNTLPHKVIRISNPYDTFNFAAINNRAANMVTSPYIMFLNDDTEIKSPRWLSQMMGYAQISGVGTVGAKLLFPDGRIQHAGIIHGLYHGLAGPAFKGTSGLDHGYLSYASVVRNYSAVTAACMLTSRELFLKLGGFDEKLYGVAYNDVDYCYRLIAGGYRCVYCPDAVLTHHEGYSRGFKDNPTEIANFRKAYREFKDPYYSPYLSLSNERFEIIPRRLSRGQINKIPALMVSHNLKWEGAPYSQYQLTLALKKKGIIDPIVFCQEDGPLRKAYEDNGIHVDIDINLAFGAISIKEYNSRLNHLSQKIAQWGIRLVYANTLLTFYAIDAARQVGLPSIWNPRESEPWQHHFNNFGAQIAKRAVECFQYPYRIIFVSDATRDVYKALNNHHNFTVIPNGLDMSDIEQTYSDWPRDSARTYLNIDKDDVVIFLLGTVTPRKGQHDLPLALSRLPVSCSKKIRCFIVGDRPCEYSQKLARIVGKLPEELQDRVSIIPETSEVAHYYRAADIFVCTSRIESYPRVILEAMAYGLPIITTPAFGIREQVREGVNALFYTPGNITELAEKMELLITNRELRDSLAANSRHVLGGLPDYEDMVKAYAEIFSEAWRSGK